MAAHTFGPIEKSLTVAYYKKGYQLSSTRPKLGNTICSKVPRPSENPIWAFSETPRVCVEGPSIANSSSFRVNLVPCFPDLDLLSRGLGYRITFTMPADKEFNIQDPDTWPQGEILVTDMFGSGIDRKS